MAAKPFRAEVSPRHALAWTGEIESDREIDDLHAADARSRAPKKDGCIAFLSRLRGRVSTAVT